VFAVGGGGACVGPLAGALTLLVDAQQPAAGLVTALGAGVSGTATLGSVDAKTQLPDRCVALQGLSSTAVLGGRLLRRRRWFRVSKLVYAGIPDPVGAAGPLLALGWLDAQHPMGLEELVALHTKAELLQLFAGSAAVLTTDSGPAHVANALGVHTIVLFGAGNENNTAPYNKNNRCIIRLGQLACEPCVSNTCKLYGVPQCLVKLDEQIIVSAVNCVLK